MAYRTAILAIVLTGALACKSRNEDAPKAAASTASTASTARGTAPSAAATTEVHFQSGPYQLRGFVLKPEGRGPFPAVVYNHGSEQDPSLEFSGELGAWFQSHGFVVFFPYRRGSGGSEGPYWKEAADKSDARRNQATVEALEAENADVVAAIEWLQRESYVDRARVAVAGCSFGGIHTVLTAEKDSGAYAAVDFAGASMSWAGSPVLQARMKTAVRDARVPIFFVQAENDFDTTPSKALAAEMKAAGKPHAVHVFPPHGKTPTAGHAHFCNHAMNEWGEEVLAFLQRPTTAP